MTTLRDPNTGYLDSLLWVPKSQINVEGTQRALSFVFSDDRGVTTLQLWKETANHLLLPREFWRVSDLPFPVVDLRPREYERVDLKSNIVLDKIHPDKSTQKDALQALLGSRGGILQLACVAGSTEIQLNRGGKGFTTTIANATYRSTAGAKYEWDYRIPTFIRADVGGRIGLHRVESFIDKGLQQVFELRLVDGKSLRATGDHEILTKNRGWVPLSELTTQDFVQTETQRLGSILKKKVAYKRIGGFNYHPYARLQSRSFVLEEHRAIAEARQNALTLSDFKERCRSGKIDGLKFIDPKKFHVHHLDGDHNNNDPANLVVETAEAHLGHHRPGASAFGRGLIEGVRVRDVRPAGVEHVYDIACAHPHNNFVANGIVVHNCGKGKTIVALELAARMSVPTLVVVGDTQLLDQWRNTILGSAGRPPALGIAKSELGLIQAQSFDWKKPIVLATYQTLANMAHNFPEECRRWFGLIIWDEAHHIAAPTFAKSADLFYGYRLGLTATPTRDDGLHVIYDFHLGGVIYKDLTQELRPKIDFLWTGFSLDLKDNDTRLRACDKNGELHNSKLATYFGQWRARLQFVLNQVKKLRMEGRKVLVLSQSIDELVNLLALWGNSPTLFTDIPIPTHKEIGETVPPDPLDNRTLGIFKRQLGQVHAALKDPNANALKVESLKQKKKDILHRLAAHETHGKIQNELRKRQKQYLADLLHKSSDAGLMIADVPAKVRTEMLRTRGVTFAIVKYGREGLDEDTLDTIIVLEPMSSRNVLQQVMGRILRKKAGKKEPHLIFLEDNIGPLMHMCKKLRRHLREWPVDEGGPYDYELVGHPLMDRRKAKPWMR